MLVHTGHDTSSRRSCSNVLISILFVKCERGEQLFRRNQLETMKPCDNLFLAFLEVAANYHNGFSYHVTGRYLFV